MKLFALVLFVLVMTGCDVDVHVQDQTKKSPHDMTCIDIYKGEYLWSERCENDEVVCYARDNTLSCFEKVNYGK